MPNPFSLLPGPLRGPVRGLTRSTPAGHHWGLLTVVHIFSAATGLWHSCADSTGVPPLTLSGVSLASRVSLLGVFFCELVAWWDVARGSFVPGSGSSGFSALYCQASNSAEETCRTPPHVSSLNFPYSILSSMAWACRCGLWRWQKGFYILNINR